MSPGLESRGEKTDVANRKRPLPPCEDDEQKGKGQKSQPFGDNLGLKAEVTKPPQEAEGHSKRESDRRRPQPACDQEESGPKRVRGQEDGKTSEAHLVHSSLKAKSAQHRQKERVEKLYKREKLLGRGGFGSVFAGTRKSDGLQVALKYARKLKDDDLQLPGQEAPAPREVALMRAVNEVPNPNVLQMYEWYDRPSSYVMVLERPDPCQDLDSYCQDQGGRLREEEARRVVEQLLPALLHCQQRGIVHRDVKPENLLIRTDTQELKLIDFGCGDPLKNTPFDSFSGTLPYQPPEWFQEGTFLAGPGTVWSVGVTLYNLVYGRLPFTKFTKACMGQVVLDDGLSAEIKDFILWCLRPHPEDRPTLEQLQLHPWLHPRF
ncbi:serine/threonine-protein kinase pim-1-like [Megalops cyprinoides]|uniref:serine/threonine-protein kinase pim-1-like n=1 Tax=Megalops cyprinoides TaxID=118141 RepID=UPI001864491F|nr:serine/threonine-protein kinase pim-1-like [Megalops cyprinoides]